MPQETPAESQAQTDKEMNDISLGINDINKFLKVIKIKWLFFLIFIIFINKTDRFYCNYLRLIHILIIYFIFRDSTLF